MNTYKRFDGESDDALIFRITGEKDKIGSWQDVADILNSLLGKDCKSDTYRKKRQCFDAMFLANKDNMFSNQEQIDKLDQKIIELKAERQKNQAINIELNKKLRQQSRFELFYENVAREISVLDVPEYKGVEQVTNVSEYDMEYILSIADIHAGASFQTDTNCYSFNELTHRFDILLSRTVTFVREKKLSKIKVLSLGDDIQGLLRISDVQLNESSVVYAVVYVAKTIAHFLNALSQCCEVDYYHVPSANHSQMRLLNTKASELANEDIEFIICNYIKDVLVNNNRISVHTNFGYDYIEIPIFDFTTIALHGHTVSNVETILKDLSFHNKKFYSVVFLGHFHAGKNVTVGQVGKSDCEIVICPSFVGDCSYSDKLLKGAKAASCIYGFDRQYGLTQTYKIILN